MQSPTHHIHCHLRDIIIDGFVGQSHDTDFVKYLLINALALKKLTLICQTRHPNLTSAGTFEKIKVDENACEELVNRLRPDVEFLLL